MCKHEIPMLIGTAAGITCRACGQTFSSFAELNANAEPADEFQADKPKRSRRKKEDTEND